MKEILQNRIKELEQELERIIAYLERLPKLPATYAMIRDAKNVLAERMEVLEKDTSQEYFGGLTNWDWSIKICAMLDDQNKLLTVKIAKKEYHFELTKSGRFSAERNGDWYKKEFYRSSQA